MKCYRFNRRRKKSLYSMYDFYKNRKKSDYIIDTGRSKMLDSGLFENQVWGALHKAWKGYVIAKNKGEDDKMELYAHRVQELQHDLGLPISSFDNIGVSASSFLWQIVQQDNNQEVPQEENYLTDTHYEKERFTDAYSENFEDDENKADRFTDDNAYRENFTD
ncbi:MAG: hypothetical protein ACJ72J_18480 [Nitrososphaeraceae archaeon]